MSVFNSDFNFNNPEQLLVLIRSFLEPEEELKRIYFYVSEPFTELEPRIRGNKKEKLEEYKEKNPKDYEKRVNKSGIIQSFNHAIAQQNQVELRVGWVKYKFEDISEEERHFGMEIRTNQERLDLRQKGIDTLLVHDIAKICYTATSRCVLLFSKDTDFAPVLKEIREQGFKIFIARIKESPISVPSDLKKSCGVRKCSVAEIVDSLPKNQHTPKKNNFPPKEPFNNPFKDKLPKKN
ncbi:NYN domain-containing protein [Helicobacter pylori]|uniref:NYN domain-containing protein n=1 Tax=Helicobacter pylori TaxID=210 RepID=UPI00387DC645